MKKIDTCLRRNLLKKKNIFFYVFILCNLKIGIDATSLKPVTLITFEILLQIETRTHALTGNYHIKSDVRTFSSLHIAHFASKC